MQKRWKTTDTSESVNVQGLSREEKIVLNDENWDLKMLFIFLCFHLKGCWCPAQKSLIIKNASDEIIKLSSILISLYYCECTLHCHQQLYCRLISFENGTKTVLLVVVYESQTSLLPLQLLLYHQILTKPPMTPISNLSLFPSSLCSRLMFCVGSSQIINLI